MLFSRFTCRVLPLALGVFLYAVVAPTVSDAAGASGQVRFASKESAFVQGYSAFKGRQYDIAVPALEFAAQRNVMRAKFYLAKIYSDNSGGFTDHARAYLKLQQIVAGYLNVDPKDYRVAPYVSQALTSIARYQRDGIKSLNLKPDTRRALAYFDHAATFFNDEDAQFEIAKHYLAGDGVEPRIPVALNWLARLSKRGHAGAQAYLANLYWDGRYTTRDRERALALITVAVENAKDEDQFWIEDVHQNIFCESDQRTRLRVQEVVDGWRRRFGRTQTVRASHDDQLNPLEVETQRVCANGDMVGDLDGSRARLREAETAALRDAGKPPKVGVSSALVQRVRPSGLVSVDEERNLNGFGLKDAGAGSTPSSVEPPTVGGPRAVSSDGNGGASSEKSPALRSLDGFTMQGKAGFGFSVVPGRQ